jgi:hypothetical protein
MRPDKRIEDTKGKVVAEPNPKDPRNTEYELFYRDPSKPCDENECPSDFSIIVHPELGYVKKPTKVIDINDEIEKKTKEYMEKYSKKSPNKAAAKTDEKIQADEIEAYKDPYSDEPDMRPRY